MNELDLLKKDWKRSENAFDQISETEIYAMLHKKSSSTVKWILVISVLEFLIWIGLSFLSSGADAYLRTMGAEKLIVYTKCLDYFHYAVIAVFIYCFYKNYVRISTTESTKALMKTILTTRKTVNYYVTYNLSMLVLVMISGFLISFVYNPNVDLLKQKISEDSMVLVIVIAILGLCIAVFALIFWLFYKLIYGRLLRKLLVNYKELKKIDF